MRSNEFVCAYKKKVVINENNIVYHATVAVNILKRNLTDRKKFFFLILLQK